MVQSKLGFASIALAVILLLVIVLALIFFWKIVLPQPIELLPKNVKNGKVIEPSLLDANSGIYRKEASFSAENTYTIRVGRKLNTTFPKDQYIPPYLTKLLQLPNSSRFVDGGFLFKSDTRTYEGLDLTKLSPYNQYESQFRKAYYLLLPKGTLDSSKTFEDDYVIATPDKPDPTIFSYLNSDKYCLSDYDCHIDYNFCSYGAFNYYKEAAFGPYGCEQGIDADYLFPNGENYTFGGQKDPQLGCFTKVTYKSAICLNQRCTGQGRTVSCINN